MPLCAEYFMALEKSTRPDSPSQRRDGAYRIFGHNAPAPPEYQAMWRNKRERSHREGAASVIWPALAIASGVSKSTAQSDIAHIEILSP